MSSEAMCEMVIKTKRAEVGDVKEADCCAAFSVSRYLHSLRVTPACLCQKCWSLTRPGGSRVCNPAKCLCHTPHAELHRLRERGSRHCAVLVLHPGKWLYPTHFLETENVIASIRDGMKCVACLCVYCIYICRCAAGTWFSSTMVQVHKLTLSIILGKGHLLCVSVCVWLCSSRCVL